MELIQIVFSPMGGTKKVADIITEEWDGTVTNIDLTNAKIFQYAYMGNIKSVLG